MNIVFQIKLTFVIFLFSVASAVESTDVNDCDALEIAGIGAERHDRLVCSGIDRMRKGNFDEAIDVLEEALSVPVPGKPNFELLPRLAWAYRQAGKEEKAASLLLEAELTLEVVSGLVICTRSTEEQDGYYLKTLFDNRRLSGRVLDGIHSHEAGESYLNTFREENDLGVAYPTEIVDKVELRMCGAAYDAFYAWRSFERILWEGDMIRNYKSVKEGICPSEGCGNAGYGANRARNDMPSTGLRQQVPLGGKVYSMIEGVVEGFGPAYSDDPSYEYVQILTDDGYKVRLFHVEPVENLTGKKVSQGDVVGRYQEVGRRYPSIAEQILVEVWRKGKYVNPSVLDLDSVDTKTTIRPRLIIDSTPAKAEFEGEGGSHCSTLDSKDSYDQLVCSARERMRDRDYDEAVPLYEKALSIRLFEKPNYTLLPELSWAYFQVGDMKKARNALLEAELSMAVSQRILECTEDMDRKNPFIFNRLSRRWDGVQPDDEYGEALVGRALGRMCSELYSHDPTIIVAIAQEANLIKKYMSIRQKMEEMGFLVYPNQKNELDKGLTIPP